MPLCSSVDRLVPEVINSVVPLLVVQPVGYNQSNGGGLPEGDQASIFPFVCAPMYGILARKMKMMIRKQDVENRIDENFNRENILPKTKTLVLLCRLGQKTKAPFPGLSHFTINNFSYLWAITIFSVCNPQLVIICNT